MKFEKHEQLGDVKRQTPDPLLAEDTLRTARERLGHAQDIKEISRPKFVLENAYEAVQEAIQAALYSRGYNSHSHQAAIAYLKVLGFGAKDIASVDRLRKQRNGIKYYGEDVTANQAEKALGIAVRLVSKIDEKVKI